ncbi:MAG: M20/M25/M40 family metallo-hydrolase [Bacteroidales bacterium]|nr:M20/M25/M40 family metallo-hydrolase [Bacteroidales bacterium]
MSCYADMLRVLVATPSVSFKEEAAAAFLGKALDGLGIKYSNLRGNIVAINAKSNPSKPTLALDAHIDTVPANEGYTRSPFDSGEDPEIVYGLGSNDDGGSVVAMIAAFKEFYEDDLPINLMLVLNREEEVSGPDGDRWLYGPDGPFGPWKEFPMPDWVIVGEPTGMKAAISERGLLVLDGLAEGISAHAASGEGENALLKALDDISVLRSHKFTRISPTMGEVKLNVTQIESGNAHNVIPDKCSFVVDIRPTEQYSCEEILSELQGICKSKLSARSLDHNSSATPEASPLLKAVKALGIGTYSSPATSNWTLLRQDAIKLGPGDSSRSHKADEFILVSEIEEAIDIYIGLIRTFYGNTLE